ncbi:hypothetical protein [Streptomyces sp. NBC_00268]|uniref:hypothetical protein n=1 Tax=Streptomyces sp. NBC_00268 TaxID=2975695 RepID=UPI002259FF20|nr:hypothetical protein [Streptomyces sp. NBC_00268]MCX5182680.1 hypothetical protein [Streptomyces sp. NBC_00268]
MIELLRLLIETVTQGIPRIGSFRESKKRRDLAVDLFLLYVRFNETMLAADLIVKQLEAYVAPEPRSERRFIIDQLRFEMERQVNNLDRLYATLSGRSAVLWIIEPDAYRRLAVMVGGKQDHLLGLRMLLERGRLPLDLNYAEISSLGARDIRSGHFLARGYAPRSFLSGGVTFDLESNDDTVIELVRAYVESGTPQDRIEDIRAALEDLRVALEANFSLAEVLVEVGDRRLER